MKRLLFIYNPRAGKELLKPKLSDVIDIFVKAGYEVVTYPTQGHRDAYEKVISYKAEDFDNDCDNFWCEFIVPTDIRNGVIKFKDFDKVTFHLGYSKDRPSMTFAIKEIVIGEGKEEWGALPGETCFVIKLGDRL